jgi:SSS family solute:Na+ symporter
VPREKEEQMGELAFLQSMVSVNDTWVDYFIIGVYFVFVLGIGAMLRTKMQTSEDYFLSGRSLPSWITVLAFLGANLGALEILGMGAGAAQYGIMQSHYYWIGAIPAMVFVAPIFSTSAASFSRASWFAVWRTSSRISGCRT